MPMTLLLVDDHDGFRARARRTLVAAGFDVVGERTDGESALQAVEQLDPDVVLLDVGLPDVTGLEVAARLSRDHRKVKVVLTSTREASDYGDLPRASGARGFISKSELSGETLAALVGPG